MSNAHRVRKAPTVRHMVCGYKRRSGWPVSVLSGSSVVRSRASGLRRLCSLMGQGRRPRYERYGRLLGCLRSLRAHLALDGVSWVQSGSVEIAVGQTTACYRIGAVIGSLPWASLRSGARFDLLSGEYCLTTPG